MKTAYAKTAALAIGLFSFSTAQADNGISARNLPERGMVTLSGTVEHVADAHDFTLRDTSGNVDIKVPDGASAVLNTGDKVTVTGTIENRMLGMGDKRIVASRVQVHKDLQASLSDAVTKTTGMTLDDAKPVQVAQLPEEGMVRLSGTVDSVGNQKHFTLRDTTGAVDIDIQSKESVVLSNGATVTVVGYVRNGMLGKKIEATRVIVTSDAGTSR